MLMRLNFLSHAGCSGGKRPDPVVSAWLKPGTSVLAVGHGISADIYSQNFPIVTSNIAQMGMFDDASSKSGGGFNVRGDLAEFIVKRTYQQVFGFPPRPRAAK